MGQRRRRRWRSTLLAAMAMVAGIDRLSSIGSNVTLRMFEAHVLLLAVLVPFLETAPASDMMEMEGIPTN